ncbi:hypothetical protein [Sphingorhabdus sp. 109]|uniref:hypothetical protein n=1 Tax=Sphingorhabdus sp. 109 TaxID=2653173 RepID=UPI0012EFDAB2|nr:hypothetical protein [Sphingorhabdus sp. 109]VWX56952.1 conserved hypothetical protein [Sphingorhabdus sp. 109]
MAIFAFYPVEAVNRRADGINFVIAEGVDEAAARSAASALVGASNLSVWTAVSVEAGMDPVAVEGMPVGASDSITWPTRTRGNATLGA